MKKICKAITGYIAYSGLALLLMAAADLHSQTNKPFANSFVCKTGNISIHYQYWESPAANKRYVLLIHGFAGSTFSWRKTADSLCKCGFDVVAVDIPPYGYSDKNPRINQSATFRSDLLNDFLNATFPGQKWTVVGHSMGGGIAQAFALAYPEKVSGVVFVAGTLFFKTETSSFTRPSVLSFAPVQNLMASIGEQYMITPKLIRRFLSSAYGVPADDDAVAGYYNALALEGTARAILNAGSSKEIKTLRATDLNVPAYAVWGSDDSFVPLSSMQKVMDTIPEIRLSVIDGAGHCPMETHHEEFMKILLEFIRH